MTWAAYHSESERLAGQAELAAHSGHENDAIDQYRKAAEAEERALQVLSPDKQRTFGITAVSAASLWLMAREYNRAEQIAYNCLSSRRLPEFATAQLRELLQDVWSEQVRANSPIKFLRGDLVVSVSGGQVVYGGAPLDLILRKVGEIRALIFRTVELKLGIALRKGRPAEEVVQQYFQPWLFQQPAGSYQFAVRVRQPEQTELFAEQMPEVETVAATALDILRASVDDPQGELQTLIPDQDYRTTFLTIARNLAPTGTSFEQLRIGSKVASAAPVVLLPSARETINQALRNSKTDRSGELEPVVGVQIRGILRGLSLNRDWLEVTTTDAEGKSQSLRIYDAGETLDDIIGPMVNHAVIVDAFRDRERDRLHLRDIQPAE